MRNLEVFIRLFAFTGQCQAQGIKGKTGGKASGGYWNYLGCEKQKIAGNGGEGCVDSHSEPDEYYIFCKK